MVAGRVLVRRDGLDDILTQNIVLSNHMVITPHAVCHYPVGSPARLTDGQLFRLDGTVIHSQDAATLRNGRVIVQKDGTIFTLRIQQPVQIFALYKLARAQADGLIMYSDGKTILLREGQTVLIEGPPSRQ